MRKNSELDERNKKKWKFEWKKEKKKTEMK
jgi:hypothetical protein